MEDLIKAIRARDVIEFSRIIKEGRIDFTKIKGRQSILHHAISSKRSSLFLKSLLERIPKENLSYLIDLENKDYVTPLSLACNIGNWDCAHLLINYGANLNTMNIKKGDRYTATTRTTPLSCVLNYFHKNPVKVANDYIADYPVGYNLNIIEKMLKNGADPNANFSISYFCPTPFWFAVLSKQEWIVKLFIEYGAIVPAERVRFMLGYRNILEKGMYVKAPDVILELLIKHCDNVKCLIDADTVIHALNYGTPRIVDVTLAFYTKYYSDIEEKHITNMMEAIISPYRKNNYALVKILTLFPNAKKTTIVFKGRNVFLELDANEEIIAIIQNFDCKLFDLLTLHIYFIDLRQEVLNHRG